MILMKSPPDQFYFKMNFNLTLQISMFKNSMLMDNNFKIQRLNIGLCDNENLPITIMQPSITIMPYIYEVHPKLFNLKP